MAQLVRGMVYLLLLLLLTFAVADAWDEIGHELVAQIAFDQLSVKKRQHAQDLIDALRSIYGYSSFVNAASWLDGLRSHDIGAFDKWHFINQPFSQDDSPLIPVQKQNVAWAIVQAESVVHSPRSNRFEKGLFLRVLIHLVGDAHQPLHCATKISKPFPTGDYGGNLFVIRYKRIRSLHTLWDRGLGYFTKRYSYPLKPHEIRELARSIEIDYPRSYFPRRVKLSSPRDWVTESFQLAKNIAYKNIEPHERPSREYIKMGRKVVKQQIALAGYRLGDELEYIL